MEPTHHAEWDCKIEAGLDSLPAEELKLLFSPLPNTVEWEQLIQRSGVEHFNFYHIAVRTNGKIALLIPLYETRFDISTFLDGWEQKIIRAAARIFPALLSPKVMAAGFMEGEWGEVGIARNLDPKILSHAWKLALRKLMDFSKTCGADLLAFHNFNQISGRDIPKDLLAGFSEAVGIPCMQVPIYHQTFEDYLHSLSKNTRKDLRRKMRGTRDITILRTKNPLPWLDTIYKLYADKVRSADMSFGMLRKNFFSDVCRAVPGAEYVLYFLNDTLIAFNLVITQADCLIDKYFAMDFNLGREYHLYFISWLDNIRTCIEKKIPLYHAGQTAEKTKARLGAKVYPSKILFRHRNPVLHFLLSSCKSFLGYKPEIDLPSPSLEQEESAFHADHETDALPAEMGWKTDLCPLCLDLDGSIPRQKELCSKLRTTEDLRPENENLRLWASRKGWSALREKLTELRKIYPQPWLTFLGSGDFHHVTLSLLETLPEAAKPLTLVLIDNHPDWCRDFPRHHCGNWVSGALELPGIESVVLIGQDSEDLAGWHAYHAPFRELCSGKLTLYPLRKKRMRVPLRWPRYVLGAAKNVRRFYGTDIHLKTLANRTPENLFREAAESLKGKNIYLSIDKDCLSRRAAVTDWEQGQLPLETLLFGIKTLLEKTHLVGADIYGEKSPRPLRGILKELDARRWSRNFYYAPETDPVNEQTNLKILETFLNSGRNSPLTAANTSHSQAELSADSLTRHE